MLPLLGVLLLAGFLRFLGLGKESLWLDETTSLIIARMGLSSVVAWAAGDIHPPLYYLLLHFWLGLGDSEFVLRALSAVWGILTVGLVYAVARELFDSRVALLSALLLAVSPLHVWYSQETRMYVMVTALSLLSSYFLLLALQRKKAAYWLGHTVAATAALYTHYFALFAFLFQGLFALYWLWRSRSPLWRQWLLAQVVVALLFSPWVPILYHQVSTGGGGWVEKSVGKPSLYALVDTWLYFSMGLDSKLYPIMLRRMAYLLFGLCALAALLSPLRCATGTLRRPLRLHASPGRPAGQAYSEQDGMTFCLASAALPVITVWLLSQVKPMYSVRYLLPFFPAYCIWVASGIDRLGSPLRCATGTLRRKGACAVPAFLLLTLLVGNWNAWRIEQNPDWRGLVSHVMSQAKPGDVVLFSPRWNVKPFDYYSQGHVPINMDLPIPVTPQAAADVVESIKRDYRRVWLVWERGHYSDPDGIAKRTLDRQGTILDELPFRGVDRLILYEFRAGAES
ncbi:MAG: hypothetical protein FJ026_00065 [Chloroflexi bacterium]|nr:hypothetical protein [Chloroflexota bacterium]